MVLFKMHSLTNWGVALLHNSGFVAIRHFLAIQHRAVLTSPPRCPRGWRTQGLKSKHRTGKMFCPECLQVMISSKQNLRTILGTMFEQFIHGPNKSKHIVISCGFPWWFSRQSLLLSTLVGLYVLSCPKAQVEVELQEAEDGEDYAHVFLQHILLPTPVETANW